jgi:hypothetical protein
MKLDAHRIRRIAVEADRDPRSVAEVIEGRGRPTTRASVVKAMARLGLPMPTPVGVRSP